MAFDDFVPFPMGTGACFLLFIFSGTHLCALCLWLKVEIFSTRIAPPEATGPRWNRVLFHGSNQRPVRLRAGIANEVYDEQPQHDARETDRIPMLFAAHKMGIHGHLQTSSVEPLVVNNKHKGSTGHRRSGS